VAIPSYELDLDEDDKSMLRRRETYVEMLTYLKIKEMGCYVTFRYESYDVVVFCASNLVIGGRAADWAPDGLDTHQTNWTPRRTTKKVVSYRVCVDCLLNGTNDDFVCDSRTPKRFKGRLPTGHEMSYSNHLRLRHRFLKLPSHEIARVVGNELEFKMEECPLPLDEAPRYSVAADGASTPAAFRLLYTPQLYTLDEILHFYAKIETGRPDFIKRLLLIK
jgi:hypothetical protein